MLRKFVVKLPQELSQAEFAREIETLASPIFRTTIRPKPPETKIGRLEQIDPTLIEIIIELLDTQAAAAAVQTTLAALIAYLSEKTGKKPDEPKNTLQ